MKGTLYEVTRLTMADANRYEYGQACEHEFEHLEVNWNSLGVLPGTRFVKKLCCSADYNKRSQKVLACKSMQQLLF